MKYKKPDLSALNHVPLHNAVPAYTRRPTESTGMMNLNGASSSKHETAGRGGLFRRILGR